MSFNSILGCKSWWFSWVFFLRDILLILLLDLFILFFLYTLWTSLPEKPFLQCLEVCLKFSEAEVSSVLQHYEGMHDSLCLSITARHANDGSVLALVEKPLKQE